MTSHTLQEVSLILNKYRACVYSLVVLLTDWQCLLTFAMKSSTCIEGGRLVFCLRSLNISLLGPCIILWWIASGGKETRDRDGEEGEKGGEEGEE